MVKFNQTWQRSYLYVYEEGVSKRSNNISICNHLGAQGTCRTHLGQNYIHACTFFVVVGKLSNLLSFPQPSHIVHRQVHVFKIESCSCVY